MTSTLIPLSKEAVQRTVEPYLEALGRADRERMKSLLGIIQSDGRILLSDALNILYPDSSTGDYEPALSAFRQFRLRLKTFTEQEAGIHFILKSDTQTRSKPNQRWCWFEGDDRSVEDVAVFSDNTTNAVRRIGCLIQQSAATMSFDDYLPTFSSQKASENPLDQMSTIPPDKQRDVLELLEEWVQKKSHPYCALLGEYGMGKTITSMRFTKHLLEKRKHDASLPLPIYLDLRNLGSKEQCDEMTLPEILETLLHNGTYESSHQESITTSKEIIRLVQEEGALIIFDGLDEVLVHLSVSESQRFTHKLLSILQTKQNLTSKKTMGQLLISCRTHYFRTIREQKTLFTEQNQGGISTEDYLILALLPLTTQQIRKYLIHTLPHIAVDTLFKLIESVHNLSELAERPYTLSLIPSMIPQIEHWKKEGFNITGATIYRHMVLSWLERDSGKHKLTTDHKQQLMEHLAAELRRSGQLSWTISNLEQWFVDFLHHRPQIGIHYTLGRNENRLYRVIDLLKEDLRTATFLVRVGDSHFRFAHTSLQEFFLATYLYRALEKERIEDWDMPLANKETLDFLGQMLSEKNNHAAMKTLEMIRDTYRPRISELAFAYMLLASERHYPTPNLSGFHLEGADLKGWTIAGQSATSEHPEKLLDLQNINFSKANLDDASLRLLNLNHANFSETHLENAEFRYGQAQHANFASAHLKGALFRHINYDKTDFSEAAIKRSQWVHCHLEGTRGLDPSHSEATFSRCEPSNQFGQTTVLTLDGGHQGVINNCAFSPDGQSLVSASWDNTLRVWNIETGQCLKLLQGHQGWVHSCSFSPDGHYIASSSEDQTLRLWDTVTGQCLRILSGHTMMVRRCAFSPDGRHLVSASLDRTLRIWDTTTGDCVKILQGHDGAVNDCAYSPDGQHIVSVSDDRTLRIWGERTGECLQIIQGHQDLVRTCTYSPNGHFLASGSADKTLKIWNAATGECLHVLTENQSRVRSCKFSPDGKYLVAALEDKTLGIWDITTNKFLHSLRGHTAKVKGCAYAPDGTLASVSDDRTIRLWNTETATLIKTLGQ